MVIQLVWSSLETKTAAKIAITFDQLTDWMPSIPKLKRDTEALCWFKTVQPFSAEQNFSTCFLPSDLKVGLLLLILYPQEGLFVQMQKFSVHLKSQSVLQQTL